MARAGLGMAALLAGVSHLAIGTAHAFEFSAPDDAQTADVVTAIVVVVGAYGGWQGLRRVLRGAGSAFWTSTLGRWLIGRIAGTSGICRPAGDRVFPGDQCHGSVLDVLFRLGVPLSNEMLIGGIVLWMWAGPILAAWHLRTIIKVCIGKGSRPLRRLVRSLGMGGGGSSAFRGDLRGVGQQVEARHDPAWRTACLTGKWLVGIRDDRMLMTVSPEPAEVKSESAIIPNLLTWIPVRFSPWTLKASMPPSPRSAGGHGADRTCSRPIERCGSGRARIESLAAARSRSAGTMSSRST